MPSNLAIVQTTAAGEALNPAEIFEDYEIDARCVPWLIQEARRAVYELKSMFCSHPTADNPGPATLRHVSGCFFATLLRYTQHRPVTLVTLLSHQQRRITLHCCLAAHSCATATLLELQS